MYDRSQVSVVARAIYLIDLDVRGFDHGDPLLDFGLVERPQSPHRGRQRRQALVFKKSCDIIRACTRLCTLSFLKMCVR
jgi:hypothetical protein